MQRREQLRWICGFLVVDLVSFLGHYQPWIQNVAFVLALIGFVVWSVEHYEMTVLVALAELFLGSFGHVLHLAIAGVDISLRLALFVVLIGMGAWRIVQQRRTWTDTGFTLPALTPLLILGVLIIFGFVQGILRGYDLTAVFRDGNGYLFIAFALPLALAMNRADFRIRWQPLLRIAALYLAVKTLWLLYFFTHQFGFFLTDLYQWIRDTGEGELTPTGTGAYRIFLQSQIYLLLAWWMVLWRSRQGGWPHVVRSVGLLGLLAGALLISFSRSFWLGFVLSLGIFMFSELSRRRWSELCRLSAITLGSVGVGVLLVLLTLRWPYPTASATGGLDIAERLQLMEPALSSRWHLLKPLWSAVKEYPVFGAGFGKTVSYVTDDPRIRAVNQSGLYTTTAFEWGYLGLWLKLGLVGLGAYLVVIWRIIRNAWQTDRLRGKSLGLILGLAAIMGVHIGSPYLDHPLGLGFITLLYVYFGYGAVPAPRQTSPLQLAAKADTFD